MNYTITLLFVFLAVFVHAQTFNLHATEVAPMPEPVSNNAVCEGFIGDTPYVYSFGGIDTTKMYSGIHLRSFRYNTLTNTWENLPDLPDTLGKIAPSANRVGDTIYVIGGYHVFQNGNEVSSNKVHRFNTQTNLWMSDGTNIPKAIDDQVQAVWNDSLIFVVTGWSNSTNVTDVQIYNPVTNSWQTGTPVPNQSVYKLFGASGTIIGNTIYYYGGAKTGGSFPAGNTLIKGEINPANPTQITWTDTILDATVKSYRSACTNFYGKAMWLGGASVTYNYDGIAYNGSGGVVPANQNFHVDASLTDWATDIINLPMDLRGIAHTSEFTRYICGGMETGQQVSNKTYRLTFNDLTWIKENNKDYPDVEIFPNPTAGIFNIKLAELDLKNASLTVMSLDGKILHSQPLLNQLETVDVNYLAPGIYMAGIQMDNSFIMSRLIIR